MLDESEIEKGTADVRIVGAFVERDGERFLNITEFDIRPTNVGDFKAKIKGLFPDDQMSE